jgi:hypothetical protein
MVTMFSGAAAPDAPVFDWESLLFAIDDARVVPIIGRDLILLPAARGAAPVPYYHYLALRLAEKLKVDPPLEPTIEEVALRHRRQGRPSESPYAALRSIVEEPSPFDHALPGALKKLARIEPLWLFVSTTFDDLMARVLREERRGATVEEIDNLLRGTPADLKTDKPGDGKAVVYRLLGRPGRPGDFALFDHERLELVLNLPELLESGGLKNLGAVLHDAMLLFLGCGFPDWLMRFFIRALRGRARSGVESQANVAETHALENTSLVLFLLNQEVGVYPGDALTFLDELDVRWDAFRKKGGGSSVVVPAGSGTDVVLSCHDDDRPRIDEIASALRRWGVRVTVSSWPATATPAVRAAIEASAAYVAFLSNHTLAAWKTHDPRLADEWQSVDARARSMSPLSTHVVGLDPDATRALRRLDPPEWMENASKHDEKDVALRLIAPLRQSKRIPDRAPWRLYCAFADDDRQYCGELAKTFLPERWLEVSHRDNVPPGNESEPWCRQQLERADAIVLLVSASLIDQRDEEIKSALRRRPSAVVIPVSLGSCGWGADPEQTKLELFTAGGAQAIMTLPERSAAWLEVGREVQLRVLDKFLK